MNSVPSGYARIEMFSFTCSGNTENSYWEVWKHQLDQGLFKSGSLKYGLHKLAKGLNECTSHNVFLLVLWGSGVALWNVENALISKQLISQPEKMSKKNLFMLWSPVRNWRTCRIIPFSFFFLVLYWSLHYRQYCSPSVSCCTTLINFGSNIVAVNCFYERCTNIVLLLGSHRNLFDFHGLSTDCM